MAFTVATIQSRLERRLKDINDIDASLLLDMATDLNQLLYREMLKADPQRFIATEVYTVTSSPSTQALPNGFRDIKEFGCGFFIRESDGTDTRIELPKTQFGSKGWGYYILGGNVVFTGINSTTTIALRYIPTLADLTSINTSEFCVTDEYKDLVLEGMVLAYYKNEEDPREQDADERFARLFNQFMEEIPQDVQMYSLPSSLYPAIPSPYLNSYINGL